MTLETFAALLTGVGTLVLAVATFLSTRSANRSARLAEAAVQLQQRPLLMASRLDDPDQKISFADDHWVRVGGGGAVAEHVDDVVYVVISLRNVGQGVAVIQGWQPYGRRLVAADAFVAPESFRPHSRDLYIPPGDIGLWQGALRDLDDPDQKEVAAAVDRRDRLTIDILYSDSDGGQRTITRFGVLPVGDDRWIATVGRHRNLDRPDPR